LQKFSLPCFYLHLVVGNFKSFVKGRPEKNQTLQQGPRRFQKRFTTFYCYIHHTLRGRFVKRYMTSGILALGSCSSRLLLIKRSETTRTERANMSLRQLMESPQAGVTWMAGRVLHIRMGIRH